VNTDTFVAVIEAAGLPAPIREYRFARPRRWRFDYAWPAHQLALEIEGGTWCGGRHVRGMGYEGDCEKYNAAALLGWTVLRVTTGMLRDRRALALLESAFAGWGAFFNESDSSDHPRSGARIMSSPVHWSRLHALYIPKNPPSDT
jgi:hypothetical protein